MTSLSFAFDAGPIPAPVVLLPLLFGLGAYLVLVSQPIGRPKPDLAERLRRLDVDERIRMDRERRDSHPIFASRVLEAMLRPILEDVGRLFAIFLERLGLAGLAELDRKLQVARPGVGPIQFLGEKAGTTVIGVALFPVMNALELRPFGTWPLWAIAAGGAISFLAPDWDLERRLTTRRLACLMELPTILDLLTIACSAGLSLEQALILVARQSQGVVARELQRAVREMALGQRSLVGALEAVAERNGIPELGQFAARTRAAYDQGVPLVQSLTIQAEALREQKRLRIVEEGGQTSVRMVLPVALFILPVLFVVLLFPAAVALLALGG